MAHTEAQETETRLADELRSAGYAPWQRQQSSVACFVASKIGIALTVLRISDYESVTLLLMHN
jgi:hypothetical protein